MIGAIRRHVWMSDSFWAVILLAQLAPQSWSNKCRRQKWINHPLLKAAKPATCSVITVEQRQQTSCQSNRPRHDVRGFDSLLVGYSLSSRRLKRQDVKMTNRQNCIGWNENARHEIAGHEHARIKMLVTKHGYRWHDYCLYLIWSYPMIRSQRCNLV